jgi:hypothetical protein
MVAVVVRLRTGVVVPILIVIATILWVRAVQEV